MALDPSIENLFAGNTTNSQDEFYNSISDKAVVSYFVGGDYTGVTKANSVVETSLLNYTIPANTIINGIRIKFTVEVQDDDSTAGTNDATIRLKTGTPGAETTKASFLVDNYEVTGENMTVSRTYFYTETTLDWEAEQSVVITGQNGETDTYAKVIGIELEIEGF